MKTTVDISEAIERELLSWPEVTAGRHRFGGREFRVGRMEIGHLHGSHIADLPFSRAMRDELVASGQVSPHHWLPDSGWVSFPIHGEQDIAAVVALFRLNYERIQTRLQRQHTGIGPAAESNQPSTYRNSHE